MSTFLRARGRSGQTEIEAGRTGQMGPKQIGRLKGEGAQ